jgi:hypothetical protein
MKEKKRVMQIRLEIIGNYSRAEMDETISNLSLESVETIHTNGFQGQDIFIYLLTVGGGAYIVQFVKFVKILCEKNSTKSVKIGNKEIKGYSFDETMALVKELNNQKEELSE